MFDEEIELYPRPPDMVLRLPMNKKWFDMVFSGEKKEEYRLRKPYWENRLDNLIKKSQKEFLALQGKEFVPSAFNFTHCGMLILEFFNGYQKDAPWFRAACDYYETRNSVQHPEWGESEYAGKEHFVFHIGAIIEGVVKKNG